MLVGLSIIIIRELVEEENKVLKIEIVGVNWRVLYRSGLKGGSKSEC